MPRPINFRYIVVLATMIALKRMAQVRCGFISVRQNSRRPTFVVPLSFGHSASKKSIGHPPTRRYLAQWNVGEKVVVQTSKDNNTLINGVIQEARGSGWYTVKLADTDEASTSPIKCRSSQLRRAVVSSTPSSSDPLASSTSNVQFFSTPNSVRPVIHPDTGTPPESPPPHPTIYDLDALLLDPPTNNDHFDMEQILHHSQYKRWVVFTDLHCAPATLDTCLQVLDRVHALAKEREAGVLFLGDFWHHRGTLRVDCLNGVLDHFRNWTVPMIMIPGNHDQVTLGGHSHSLTPFQNAYRVGNVAGPLILSYPTKFRNALFVPHIRDVAVMESVLQSPMALNEVSALFVHADVTGAMMNDLIVSMHGIPPASFPMHKLVYSGHFHKPHTVKAAGDNIRVEYLGSPYETSLSEAQQSKTLAILDENWECMEYVPIDVGRRHFKVSSWDELVKLHLETDDTVLLPHTVRLRSGDRVVASIPKAEIDSISAEQQNHIQALRVGGVMVEIREVKAVVEQARRSTVVQGQPDQVVAEMNPESTWRAYISEELEQRKNRGENSAERLLNAGLEILEQVQASEDLQSSSRSASVTDLSLTQVSVEGFGPFCDKITYPLSDRGMVLLKGTNNDVGSDSNGSGKTSLAMAALWALTGSLDPRRAQDGKVSDVIHDTSKTARVTLDGTLNGAPFTISRSKTASKSELLFWLDGIELTTQSAKETQALIEEHLGVTVSILSRTMFHGQHSINELLEATDTKLKEELSLVVPLALWQTAASRSRLESREAGKRAAEYGGMIALRTQDVERLAMRRAQAESAVDQKEAKIASLEEKLKATAAAVIQESSETDFQEMESLMEAAISDLDSLETEYKQIRLQKDAALETLQTDLRLASESYQKTASEVQGAEREVFRATINLEAADKAMQNLEGKWSLKLHGGNSTAISAPEVCPTCGQSIDANGDGHNHQDIESLMLNEIETTTAERCEANQTISLAQKELQVLRERMKVEKDRLVTLENELQNAESDWSTKMGAVNQSIQRKAKERNQLSTQMAEAARQSKEAARNDATLAEIRMENSSLQYSKETLSDITEEVERLEERLTEMKDKLEEENSRAKTMAELSDQFGQRGVQAYVLQDVVDVLQACCQSYLDELSDGSQRLELALDAGDRISRTAFVVGTDGAYKERPLASLSGGQWRRCSLALMFGFAELVARRGRLRTSMCVLDEPLTHLDRSGRSKVGDVIRKLLQAKDIPGNLDGFGVGGMSTVILILQDLAAEELDEAFDRVDEVVKENSMSHVKADGFRWV